VHIGTCPSQAAATARPFADPNESEREEGRESARVKKETMISKKGAGRAGLPGEKKKKNRTSEKEEGEDPSEKRRARGGGKVSIT